MQCTDAARHTLCNKPTMCGRSMQSLTHAPPGHSLLGEPPLLSIASCSPHAVAAPVFCPRVSPNTCLQDQ